MIKKSGFTLIEILMVIAIIGVLSGVVLVVTLGARNLSNDAAIKGSLDQLKKQAEVYYSDNGFYSNTGGCVANLGTGCFSSACQAPNPIVFADPQISTMLTSLGNLAGGTGVTNMRCRASSESAGSNWAVSAKLSGTGNYWCVDSSGQAKSESTITINSATGLCN